jgi:hypothetical protein
MAYDFIDQNIVASCTIEKRTDDSFYFPDLGDNQHTGFAFDGSYYRVGVLQPDTPRASWFTEAFGTYRGSTPAFPTYGLVLLSPAALAILDQSVPVLTAGQLPLWMLFVLGDTNALANNYNGSVQGFLPRGVCYADGVVSVTYSPDPGNQPNNLTHPILTPLVAPPPAQSSMVVSIDFTLDRVYLDVAV